MQWIFVALLIASMIHMVEEYFYPGGFMEMMKRFRPSFAPFVTVPMAIIINGLQLLLCVAAIVIGERVILFSLSIAALLLINSLAHIAACFWKKGYAPGVISGVLLYLPISLYAYYRALNAGLLTTDGVIVTFVLGLLYSAVPISYLALASRRLSKHGGN